MASPLSLTSPCTQCSATPLITALMSPDRGIDHSPGPRGGQGWGYYFRQLQLHSTLLSMSRKCSLHYWSDTFYIFTLLNNVSTTHIPPDLENINPAGGKVQCHPAPDTGTAVVRQWTHCGHWWVFVVHDMVVTRMIQLA